MVPFDPLFRNPHVATLAGHFWPAGLDERRYPVESGLHETAPGVRVLVETQRPRLHSRGHVVLIHGLEGSSRSGYMKRVAAAALDAGFTAHRFNLRSCGSVQGLSPTGYHGGLTCDLRAFLERLAAQDRSPRFAVGFSLGGNVALKLAGELADTGPSLLAGVCAVSTPIDLEACVRRLEEPQNRLYELRFIRDLKRRIGRLPGGAQWTRRLRSVRRLREFDDLVTAPAFGFGSAGDYYRTQSARLFLDAIRVPFMILQAKDDPVIPFSVFDGVPNVLAVEHGGHVGFFSRRPPRFWAAGAILEWIESHCP